MIHNIELRCGDVDCCGTVEIYEVSCDACNVTGHPAEITNELKYPIFDGSERDVIMKEFFADHLHCKGCGENVYIDWLRCDKCGEGMPIPALACGGCSEPLDILKLRMERFGEKIFARVFIIQRCPCVPPSQEEEAPTPQNKLRLIQGGRRT